MKNYVIAGLIMLAALNVARATETECVGMRVLPAPGKVTIDGKFDDWDLSGGIFICGDVEKLRDDFSSWFHLMYDGEFLYALARVKDPHPLVNSRGPDAEPPNQFDPRLVHGDYLTVRIIAERGTKQELISHLTFRQGKGGMDIMELAGGRDRYERSRTTAPATGARQKFVKDADGKGYTHELAVPLKLLTKNGRGLKAGEVILLTIDQSFSWSYEVKDHFRSGKVPDRTFTARAYDCWGPAAFASKGNVKPQPVRLSDRREFEVTLEKGIPAVDWTGLAKGTGFKPISFTMPMDGYVSLNIKNADGVVVRQLLTAEAMAKGKHEVKWDGLTTPAWTTPGTAVDPGEYTWSAIYHTGIGLRLRGWAYHGPSDPWDVSPTSYWGGDQALPIAAETDDEKIYLGWAGSEAGKALIALDLDDNVLWAAGYHFNSACLIAADGDVVYYAGGGIKRVNKKNGKAANWPGRKSAELKISELWGDRSGMPAAVAWSSGGFDARDGKLYLSFSQWTWGSRDVTDWRSFLTKLVMGAMPGKTQDPISKIVWEKLDDRCKDDIKGFLKGEKPPTEAFKTNAYWIPDARNVVNGHMRGLLSNKTLVKGADKMGGGELAEANRRLIEKTFGSSVIKAYSNFVAVVDAQTYKLLRTFDVQAPGRIVLSGDELLIVSDQNKVLALNTETGEIRTVIEGLASATTLTVDKEGNIYIAILGEDQQIFVYSPKGELLRKIGKKGGRVRSGPWEPSGMNNVWGLAVDARDRIWAAEVDLVPKRMSAWDIKTGEFVKEYFGPTHYGGSGGAVNPRDPNIIIGEGCEFRLDPKTGRAKFTGIITQDVYHGLARFCEGANGKLYLAATFSGRMWGPGAPRQIRIWERVSEGRYAYRASIVPHKGKTSFWADENGDEEEQPEEVTTLPVVYGVSGYNNWSMNLNTDLTFYGSHNKKSVQVKIAGFTECGAPKYDLDEVKELPSLRGSVMSSPDNRVLLCAESDDYFHCYEVETGKKLWTYPNRFSGVHGSHRAPGYAVGLVRGAFGIVGNARFPDPIGALWVVNTNVGEWHVLTQDGYYLTALFEGDPQKRKWPEKAVPGAVMDNCPCGLGGEDFGGSAIQGKDGKLYLEAGKLALWNVEVVGLENVKAFKGGKFTLSADDALTAEIVRGGALQAIAKPKGVTVKRMQSPPEGKPIFSGDLGRDFRGAKRFSYRKQRNAEVTSVIAWDDENLYLGWDVKDETPWANAADEVEYMYASGDTVDFQLGADPGAPGKRGQAARGDLRLSIGNFRNEPTAVIYREIAAVGVKRNAKTFSSGVVAEFTVESVEVVKDAKIVVETGKNGYVVEAAIPLATLGVKLTKGMSLKGDFGVTHGDPNGQDTVLRTYWSNQATGIVNDEVFELKMQPGNWGKLSFEE